MLGIKYKTAELCEIVNTAHVIVADRPIYYTPENNNEFSESSNYVESQFFLNEDRYTEIDESSGTSTVFKKELLFNNKETKEYVITCDYGELQKTSIYLARRPGFTNFFLFGKTTETDKLPKLLASVEKYLELQSIEYAKQLSVAGVILKYNNSKYYVKIFNKYVVLN